MKLTLKRTDFTDVSTIGSLYINNIFECFTLEDRVRDVKIKNETAIPKGTYEVVINYSNHFQQYMPLLINVPNYEGVRIHWGNYSKDTDGCILLGTTKSKDFIGNSKTEYKKFLSKLNSVIKTEKIYITIE